MPASHLHVVVPHPHTFQTSTSFILVKPISNLVFQIVSCNFIDRPGEAIRSTLWRLTEILEWISRSRTTVVMSGYLVPRSIEVWRYKCFTEWNSIILTQFLVNTWIFHHRVFLAIVFCLMIKFYRANHEYPNVICTFNL